MKNRGAVSAPALILWGLVVSLVAGCALESQDVRPPGSPPLHRGPGGTYVPGDTTYHGSGGP